MVYHKIDPRNEIGINSISPKRFREQVQFLVDNQYQTCTFEDIISSKKSHSKAIIITFDDGYESVFKYSYPILKEAGFKAVIFIITGYVGQLNNWDANLAGIQFRHLSIHQIELLVKDGWEIGSHSVNHRPLSYLNQKRLNDEIIHSFNELKKITKKDITSFSYPFGMQNSRVQKVVQQAGYKLACRNISGNNNCDNLLAIPRIPVYKFDTVRTLKRKLALIEYPLEKLKLLLLNWPGRFTPLYQILFRKHLFLEK